MCIFHRAEIVQAQCECCLIRWKQNSKLLVYVFRFVRRFEREVSVSSTDSGLSVNSPHMPSTPENSCTTTESQPPKQSMHIFFCY